MTGICSATMLNVGDYQEYAMHHPDSTYCYFIRTVIVVKTPDYLLVELLRMESKRFWGQTERIGVEKVTGRETMTLDDWQDAMIEAIEKINPPNPNPIPIKE